MAKKPPPSQPGGGSRCGTCGGAGGKNVGRLDKNGETTRIWESCRPCGGSGKA